MSLSTNRECMLRRAVTIPCYVLLLIFGIITTPVVLPLLAVADTAGRRRFAMSRAWTLGLCYFSCQVGALVIAAWISLSRNEPKARQLERYAALQRGWSKVLLRLVRWLYRIQIEIEGGECTTDGPFLLLIRHVSPVDNLLPGALVGSSPPLVTRYVINRMLLRDPCVDVVANQLGSAFVRAGSEGSLQDIRKVAGLARDLGPNEAVAIFPEGALYTPARHAEALAALREGRDPALAELAASFRRVLPPHLGGTFALLNAAEDVDVVFCAHAGLEPAASYRSIANGDPIGTVLRVKFWRVPAAEIPKGRAERGRWLLEEWADVDRWVSNIVDGSEPRRSVDRDSLAGTGGA